MAQLSTAYGSLDRECTVGYTHVVGIKENYRLDSSSYWIMCRADGLEPPIKKNHREETNKCEKFSNPPL